LFLGHVTGTLEKIVSRVFILFTSEQLDAQEFDFGNFNMTNVKELFKVSLGQHPKDGGYGDRDGKIGHFLDDEVTDLYQECKK
jgi:amidophosphoribosyltransferase